VKNWYPIPQEMVRHTGSQWVVPKVLQLAEKAAAGDEKPATDEPGAAKPQTSKE
jgi:hypothetical protein